MDNQPDQNSKEPTLVRTGTTEKSQPIQGDRVESILLSPKPPAQTSSPVRSGLDKPPRKKLKWTWVILVIVVLGLGGFVWLIKPDKECLGLGNFLSNIKHLNSRPNFSELVKESENYTNLQVEVHSSYNGKSETNSMVLVKGDRSRVSQGLDREVYIDSHRKKYYLYNPSTDTYQEGDLDDFLLTRVDWRNPIKDVEQEEPKGKEIIDGKSAWKFDYVFHKSWPTYFERYVWLWDCNGLPLRFEAIDKEGHIVNYQYSNFGKIKDSDVTLPVDAKKTD